MLDDTLHECQIFDFKAATPYISKVHVLDMTLWGLNTSHDLRDSSIWEPAC